MEQHHRKSSLFPLHEVPAARKIPEGLLITFEGGEGSGKTTQAIRLFLKLKHLGVPVMLGREPGSTPLGAHIRRWIKEHGDTTPLAETLLFAAARAQLMATAVRPGLKEGRVVILDRYVDSTLAYQGYGRRFDRATIQIINDIATAEKNPDLTVLLDLEPSTALKRLGAVEQPSLSLAEVKIKIRLDPADQRRFEKESMDFHRRVLHGYREIVQQNRNRWSVINADQPRHRIADAIWKRVDGLLRSHFGDRYQRLLDTRGGYRFSKETEATIHDPGPNVLVANSLLNAS